MLQTIRYLKRYSVLARDGEVGRIVDLFFSDQSWTISYLVVKTGWLFGRKLLIAPEGVDDLDRPEEQLMLRISREQVEQSPEIDVDQPVSRQKQEELHRYFGWTTPYWLPAEPALTSPLPPPLTAPPMAKPAADEGSDPHLRSAGEVIDYTLQARDGELGHVDDFLIDDEHWRIRYLVIDTGNWLSGKKVLISPAEARQLSWEERRVQIERSREEIRNSPEYDPSELVSRDYEERLHDYFGWPKYWR